MQIYARYIFELLWKVGEKGAPLITANLYLNAFVYFATPAAAVHNLKLKIQRLM